VSSPQATIRRLDTIDHAQVDGLADLLVDCVDAGASVGFMHPLTKDRAVAFWRRVADGVAAGNGLFLRCASGEYAREGDTAVSVRHHDVQLSAARPAGRRAKVS